MERVHLARTDGIGVANGNGLRFVPVAGGPGGQGVVVAENRELQEIVDVVAAEEHLLAADVVIHAADPLIVGVVSREAPKVGAARIRGSREVGGGQLQSRRIECGNRNLVAGVGVAVHVLQLSGRTQAAAVGLGGIHHAEVAFQRCGRGVIGRVGRRIAALPRALVAAEEEKLVLDDPAASHAAELVALQRVADRLRNNGPLGPRVQVAIA